MLIDTHTHLYSEKFDEDRKEMVQRALEAGVERFYLPNVDLDSIEPMYELQRAFPDHMFPMMGLHPCSVKEDYKEVLARIKEHLDRGGFAAVGEIGMDLYWDKSFRKEQEEAFLIQCEWAEEKNLPIVIHSRETNPILIDMIRSYGVGRLNGIFHCFSGTYEQGVDIIGMDFYLGIGGVLTFKKSGLDAVVKRLPLDRLVLETDAPYLSPTPNRGKRNESAFVVHVAQKLADIKEISFEQVAEATSANANKIFVS